MISIIVPTYNEAGNIKKLVRRIHKAVRKDYEIIIVDDNSHEKTWKIAGKLGEKYPVKVVRRKGKLGLSTAVMKGFDEARGEIIGVIDAELSHPPELIPKLVEPIRKNKADITIGSRYIKGGSVEEWPFFRRLMSKAATLLARPLTAARDPMSGYFFMKGKVIEGRKKLLKPKGYKILLGILVKGEYNKFREVPYIFRNRNIGKSKIGAKITMNYIQHLGSLYKYKISS